MITQFQNLIAHVGMTEEESGRSLRDRLGETDSILLVNHLVNSARGELLDVLITHDRLTIGAKQFV